MSAALPAPDPSIPSLVQQLRSADQRRAAMQALIFTLSNQPQLAGAFVAAGGLPPCVRQLTAPGARDTDLIFSARLVGILMQQDSAAWLATQRAVVASGCVPVVVRMLGSRDVEMQYAAAAVCMNLWAIDGAFSDVLAEAGAVPLLASLLSRSSSDASMPDAEWMEGAAAISLSNIAHGSPPTVEAVVAAGGIPAFVRLLGSRCPDARTSAATGLYLLARGCSEERLAALAAAGAIPALVRRVEQTREDAWRCVVAGAALSSLIQGSPERARAAAAAGAAPALQRLLDPSHTTLKPSARDPISAALRELSEVCVQHPTHSQPAQPPASQAPAAGAGPAEPQPHPPLPRVCAAPGCNATHGLRRCGCCHAVRYCSVACSRANWRAHKSECRRLQAAAVAAADSRSTAERRRVVSSFPHTRPAL